MSQALAIFQSRMTLCAEIFRTSAVSSTLSPPKNSELHDPRFAWVDLRQSIQRFVDSDDLTVPGARGDFRHVVQIQVYCRAAPFGHALGAGSIDQNPPHHVCRNSEEMSSILPANAVSPDQAKENLVDQGGGLHGVARPLLMHVSRGHSAQFPVHLRRKFL